MRPRSHTTLFPYTTLFRSARRAGGPQAPGARAEAAAPGGGAVLRPRRAGAFGTPHGPGRRDDVAPGPGPLPRPRDRKSTRLNSSHTVISYAVFCLKKKSAI